MFLLLLLLQTSCDQIDRTPRPREREKTRGVTTERKRKPIITLKYKKSHLIYILRDSVILS